MAQDASVQYISAGSDLDTECIRIDNARCYEENSAIVQSMQEGSVIAGQHSLSSNSHRLQQPEVVSLRGKVEKNLDQIKQIINKEEFEADEIIQRNAVESGLHSNKSSSSIQINQEGRRTVDAPAEGQTAGRKPLSFPKAYFGKSTPSK